MGPKHVKRSPFWFDVKKGCIVDWVDHTENVQKLLLNASRLLCDTETIEHLKKICEKVPLFSKLASDVLNEIESREMGGVPNQARLNDW